jgi:2-deoxy-D-gluconate 3-dehydrogenase
LAAGGAAGAGGGRGAGANPGAGGAGAGRRYHAIRADLAKQPDCAGVVAATVAALGRLDILVNNAGIIRRADALDFTETDWDEVMDLNLKTAFFLSQAAARQMLAADDGGRIINIASMLSFQGGIRIASYTASKSGIAGLTRLLANEWAARGINVNAIAPGYFVTDNTSALRADPVRSREILARIPAGRWGEPRELAGAAVFLAGPASDYVHGAIIPVDGGWLAR